MSALVLCPYVHRQSFEEMFETMHPSLSGGALCLDNTETNRGAAGSRNVGARRILDQGIDWLVDVSPVTRFGPHAGLDFVAQLAGSDAWVVQSSAPVNWHLIAWSRRLFERVGLFDENFWPIYGEDADMARRVHIAAEEDGRNAVWDCVDADAWVTMYGHSVRLAGIVPNMERCWTYYRAKWGGMSGAETYRRPFNAGESLAWWPRPPHSLHVPHEGWPA